MEKKEIVKQSGIKDCGPACIQSILIHYDGYISLEKIRIDAYTDEEGTSAYHMIECFKQYGFDAKGVKATINQLFLEDMILPCVAHVILKNGLQHYLVVYKITKTTITCMDPSKGKIIYTKSEFEEIFNELLILCHPKSNLIQYELPKKWMEELYLQFINERKKLKIIIIYSIVILIFNLIFSYFYRYLNDYFGNGGKNIFLIIVIMFFLIILKNIYNHYLGEKKLYLYKNIELNNSFHFLKHIYLLPQKTLNSYSAGELVTRIYESFDISKLMNEFVLLLIEIITALPIAIILYILSKKLFILFFIMIIIYIVLTLVNNWIIKRNIQYVIDYHSDLNHYLVDQIKNIKTVKHLNKTKNVIKNIEMKLIIYLKQKLKIQEISLINLFLKNLIQDFYSYGLITLGLYLVYQQELDFITFIMFQTLTPFLEIPLKTFLDSMANIPILKLLLLKQSDMLALENEKSDGINERFINGNIEFKNIHYSYDNYQDTLKEFNLKIKEQQHLLFFGTSGSGKSTVCQLLNRNLEYTKGHIKIQNKELKDYHLNTIKDNIVYLSQSEELIDATIKENILFYKEVSEKKFQEICEICELENIVEKKPFRYDTIIQNDLKCLSGGEKQRIMLARTLLEERQIYILDEVLSEVDDVLAKKIIKNIRKYLKGKTLIFVSHKKIQSLFDETILFS